jgi:hypothetical protein
MAFLRFTRDKRGYEHFYLVQPTTNRRGKVRTRILYWFRTPPNVKVGRQPFDDALRRALEAQNPGVTFDWQKIVETPIPSADAEKWRERRRAERAERVARQAATDVEEATDESAAVEVEADESATDEPASDDQTIEASPGSPANGPEVRAAQPDERQQQQQRRRRRRRGRRGRPDRPQESQPGEAPTTPDASPPSDTPESHEPQ